MSVFLRLCNAYVTGGLCADKYEICKKKMPHRSGAKSYEGNVPCAATDGDSA